jgi:hypothetical protein
MLNKNLVGRRGSGRLIPPDSGRMVPPGPVYIHLKKYKIKFIVFLLVY